MKRLITNVTQLLCLGLVVPFVLPESEAYAQTSPTGKRRVKRRVRKKPNPDATNNPVTSSTDPFNERQQAAPQKKNQFGVASVVGYNMTFAEVPLVSGEKKSYTALGWDASLYGRYKLNLKSFAVPIDLGLNYMSMGRIEDDGTTKVEVTQSFMSLSVGGGVEFSFGKSAIPAMLYIDYKLSDSVTTKSDEGSGSASGVFGTVYRIKVQTGYIYNLSFAKLGAVGGFHMIGISPKVQVEGAESSMFSGLYGGLYLGAEF